MPTPGTVTLDYVTLPTQATPYGSDPTILVEAYNPLTNTIPLTAKIPTGYNTDVFGFQVEDGGLLVPAAVDFTITWNPPTGTPAVNYSGSLKPRVPPSLSGRKLRVTILTKKVPKGGSPLTARKMKKKKPTAKATKVATKAKATKKKS